MSVKGCHWTFIVMLDKERGAEHGLEKRICFGFYIIGGVIGSSSLVPIRILLTIL